MKKVCGKGINNLKGVSYDLRFYKTWASMLRRCYDSNMHSKHPTYIGCCVCEEWLTFSNFKAWMEKQNWEGKQLDKDLLISGNKVYSPETCVFVNRELNLFLIESNSSRGLLPLGVSLHKPSMKYLSHCSVKGKIKHLGLFDTAEEAHLQWIKVKRELAVELSKLETDNRVLCAILKRYNEYEELYLNKK